jgi:hypothetical protein
MNDKNATVTLPVELLNALLNYLASKPFGEVHSFITEIQRNAAAQQSQDLPPPKE